MIYLVKIALWLNKSLFKVITGLGCEQNRQRLKKTGIACEKNRQRL
jgi:hypothetical protein